MSGLAIALLLGEPVPSAEAIFWAGIAGAAGVVGLGGFYYALSHGTMGVVAPLSALIGAGLPVVVGLISGESVHAVRALGMGAALTAVVLISLPGGERTTDERRLLRIDLHQGSVTSEELHAELRKPAELARSLAVQVERLRVLSPRPVTALLE